MTFELKLIAQQVSINYSSQVVSTLQWMNLAAFEEYDDSLED